MRPGDFHKPGPGRKILFMSSTTKIGLKLCGSCNPHIQVGQLYREIKEEALRSGLEIEFRPWDEPGCELLLVISGCPADCAERPAHPIREVAVAGETLNRNPCSREHLAKRGFYTAFTFLIKNNFIFMIVLNIFCAF